MNSSTLLELARQHRLCYGRSWEHYFVLGSTSLGAYVEDVPLAFRWDFAARLWPLDDGEMMVCWDGLDFRILRTSDEPMLRPRWHVKLPRLSTTAASTTP